MIQEHMTETTRRRHKRLEVDFESEIQSSDSTPQIAKVHNISESGICISLSQNCKLHSGNGIYLHFNLPNQRNIKIAGTIKWTSNESSALKKYGVEFFGLVDRNREALKHFIESQSGDQADLHMEAEMQIKFKVDTDANEKIFIKLAGVLNPLESQAFRDCLVEKMNAMQAAQLLAFVDLAHFKPCSEESLTYIRKGLISLKNYNSLLGVMVGPNTVGMLQFRRIAREAHIAEQFIAMEDEREAIAFCNAIAEQQKQGM